MVTKYRVQGPDGAIHVFEGPDDASPSQIEDFAAQTFGSAPTPQPTNAPPYFEISGVGSTGVSDTRRAPGLATQFGRTAASLADVTLGGILPGAAQLIGYPLARLQRSPEEAQIATQRLVSALDKPFGKLAGVTETPEYKQEAGREILDFISENFQKGAKFIAEKTGLPVSDVESYMGSLSLAAPAVAKPIARTVQEISAPLVEKSVIGARMPFEERLQARRERLSAEDYARGPQIDAITEAQRLGIFLSPENIQPTLGPRTLSAIAGQRGTDAIANANKNQIRKVALNELGLPETTQFDSKVPFNEARMRVAEPYSQVKKLPTMVADDSITSALNNLRPDEALICSDKYSKATNAIIDDAVKKTSSGLTGSEVLKNVQTLRQRAQKTYNNKSADLASLDLADANLAIANVLESMIETNIFNPKLLSQFRDARQKMAKTYAYEAATDFNTGMIDVNKLSRVTAKDTVMTGDIAALGKIAGNFPEAFTTKVTESILSTPRITRSGIGGATGAGLGYQVGGVTGSLVGTALGALAGEGAGMFASKIISSPGYQAGLSLRDMRIPVNQVAAAAAPIPQNQAIVPYQPEVVGPSTGGPANKLRIIGYDQNGRPIYKAEESRQGFTTPQQAPEFGPTVFESQRGLPNEVPRQIYEAQKRAEMAQEFKAAAERKPARGEVILDLDPITGRLREASQGIKGATPETFQKLSALDDAAKKVTDGKLFDLTATEKIAWNKAKVDFAEVAPGFKSLTDKAIANKMMDRAWIEETIAKAREKAAMFDEISKRGADEKARRVAAIERDKVIDGLEMLEDRLTAMRPTSSGIQGPKTREAIRNRMQGGLLTSPAPVGIPTPSKRLLTPNKD